MVCPIGKLIKAGAHFQLASGRVKQCDIDGGTPGMGRSSTRVGEKFWIGCMVPIPKGMLGQRPFRPPDIATEWKLLRKAWSLHRNGRYKLSQKRVDDAACRLYASDPVNDLDEWLWRFLGYLGQPTYELLFQQLIAKIQPLFNRHSPDDIQIRGNRTTAPSPRELCSHCSHPMT